MSTTRDISEAPALYHVLRSLYVYDSSGSLLPFLSISRSIPTNSRGSRANNVDGTDRGKFFGKGVVCNGVSTHDDAKFMGYREVILLCSLDLVAHIR